MASGPVRQRYALATGGGLQQADSSTKVLKLAKGGAVKAAYLTPTNMNGKAVGSTDRIGNAPKRVAVPGNTKFKSGMNVSGLKGDDKFTTVTQKKSHLAPGFKVQKP